MQKLVALYYIGLFISLYGNIRVLIISQLISLSYEHIRVTLCDEEAVVFKDFKQNKKLFYFIVAYILSISSYRTYLYILNSLKELLLNFIVAVAGPSDRLLSDLTLVVKSKF